MAKVTHSDKRRALIIGGSLGGLFAGNLLRQVGWDVSIFERSAHDLDSRGGGIVLQPEVVEVFRRASVDIQTMISASDPSTGLFFGRMARSSPSISPHKRRLHGPLSTRL